ncbi:MAG: hypothetical protein JXB42_12795 [Deltaproteobacteria bacterium]|nr:hypothetical protein [Deltaproteobacteria bacterium]
MEDKELQELIKKSGETDLATLIGAKEAAKRALLESPTAANLAAFNLASKTLKERAAGEDRSAFKTRADALEYLQAQGYKIKKSKLYQDVSRGLLKVESDGSVLKSSLDIYIVSPLSGLSQAVESDDELDKLTRERIKAQTIREKAQSEHWKIKTDKEKGLLVERSAFEHALAVRALRLKSDLENHARADAPEIIDLVKGDHKKTIRLMEYLIARYNEFLDRYTKDPEIIPPETERDEEKEDEDAAL